MAAFTVEVPTPILVYGERDAVKGEVWLTNSGGADIKITGASLHVDFPTPETGAIPLPDDSGIAAGATRRLTIRSGMPEFAPPGTYDATVTLQTSVGDQVISAVVVIASVFGVELAPGVLTFTKVAKSATLTGTVLVVNRGNTPVEVGAIPDEAILEMVAIPRILAVSGGTVSVEPAIGMVPGANVTFTNDRPTIPPSGWAATEITLTMPATLTADRHFRVLPRIATQRLIVDLLT